jgi:tetratricopeptide (TPR) repeat protein
VSLFNDEYTRSTHISADELIACIPKIEFALTPGIMKATQTSNAITERLNILSRLWADFRSLPLPRICRWLIGPDDKQMIKAFLETTYLEENPAKDLFIPFYAGCTRSDTYTGQLIAELRQALAADREALVEEGIILTGPFEMPEAGQALTPDDFLTHLQLVADQVPAAQLVVAVLMPGTAGRQLGKWLEQAAGCQIPANIRLLVVDNASEKVMAQAASRFPDQISTSQLALDVPGAMLQLASAGNPTDPGVLFRQAFLVLSQAAASGKLAEVKRMQAPALWMAREQGWVPMEIAVHSLVAAAYISLNRLPDAGRRYDQAYGLAKKAYLAGDPVALTLAVQCLFNKGSVLMARKAFPEAAQTYALAATHAREANDDFQVMEAKRMQGHCLEKCSEWEEAFRVEQEALATAELLEEQVRVNSTLPFLGKSLLDLAYQMGFKDEYLQLEDKLNALAGPGWQSKLKTAKATAG